MTFNDFTPEDGLTYLNIDAEEVRRYELEDSRQFVIKFPLALNVVGGVHTIAYEWLEDEKDGAEIAMIQIPFNPKRDVCKWVSSLSEQEYMEKYKEPWQQINQARRSYELSDTRKITVHDPFALAEHGGYHIVLYRFNGKLAGASIPFTAGVDALRYLNKTETRDNNP